jgi:uncharacterized protein
MEGTEMTSVFHPGEIDVQAQAGVRDRADRIGRSIGSTIPPAAREFLNSQPLAVMATLDAARRVWASVLAGSPGFAQAMDERTLRINASMAPGDPLADNLLINDQVGLIIIDFETRRRMRLNGQAEVKSDGAIYVHARQVYSNCPKYIQARKWSQRTQSPGRSSSEHATTGLTERQRQWIRGADTFFIASSHAEGGADASHRGGSPGFVQILDERRLIWPDYAGNAMFQTLGNLAVNPHAGLLFVDFENGNTLQLTGTGKIVWDKKRIAEFVGAERLVEFYIDETIELTGAIPSQWDFGDYSRFNPRAAEQLSGR